MIRWPGLSGTSVDFQFNLPHHDPRLLLPTRDQSPPYSMFHHSLAVTVAPMTGLGLSIAFIIVAITVFRMHAFFALMCAAMIVGMLHAVGQPGDHRFVKAIELVMTEMGATTGKIGFTIAVAAVIGMCLMESGAADKIIRRFVSAIGEARAGLSLLACSFTLCAPVFFDTVMLLLLPLARALGLRTGKNYLLYVLVICAGGAVSNGLIPPAPGPLFVAESLKIDLGEAILAGISFGILPSLGAYAAASWMNSRMSVPVREIPGSSLESLSAIASKPESELPHFLPAIAPIVLPIFLIGGASFMGFFKASVPRELALGVELLGNKNIIHYVWLAWLISASIRAVQGSATVATITAVGIMQSLAGNNGFGVHPIYIMTAIGFGSKFLNWMNDSGFWVVTKFSGLTQNEMLRSWTILASVLSVLGLLEVVIISKLFPLF
ncbi:MAG: hypothetical protein EBS01_02200 [Verrucomicrobia bacterium]|nr:hypothetical protein [Verrucomicrobiota bacterium]